MKSDRPKDENGADDLPREARPVATPRSISVASNAAMPRTPPPPTSDALLYRKSPVTGAKLCSMGHILMENRNGLAIDAVTTRVSGHAERPVER